MIWFIFSIIFFCFGFIFGIVFLLLLLLCFSLQKPCKQPRKKPKHAKEDKVINFGDATQLQWLNRLLWRAYPLLLDRHAIKVAIKDVFAQITRDIQQFAKLTLTEFTSGLTPPILDDASLHLEENYDYLQFCFHFEPDLDIAARIDYNLYIIGNIPFAAEFELHSLRGHFIVKIPPRNGNVTIEIQENTNINFDIATQFGWVHFKSEEWKVVWQSLKDWIHYFLHHIVIQVPLEDNLTKIIKEIDSKPPPEETVDMSQLEIKLPESSQTKQATSKSKKKPVKERKATIPKNKSQSGKSQKIVLRHYMAAWDYEF